MIVLLECVVVRRGGLEKSVVKSVSRVRRDKFVQGGDSADRSLVEIARAMMVIMVMHVRKSAQVILSYTDRSNRVMEKERVD